MDESVLVDFGPPVTGPHAIYVSRTPPVQSPIRHRWPSDAPRLSVPRPNHPNPATDLVLRTLLLPLPDQSRTPTFYETNTGIITPYYPHPDIDLRIPRHPLTIQRERQIPVATNITASCIGLTFDPATFRRSSLRFLASCDDRGTLLSALINLYRGTVIAGFKKSFQSDIIKGMNLPRPLEARLLAEISPRRILFDKRCIEWLITETLAANPSPWGMPSPTASTKELEKLFFPSLVHGHPPRLCEILRSVFFAHESYEQRDTRPGESPEDFALGTLAACSLQEMQQTPTLALARMSRIWSTRPSDTTTHQLLDLFKTNTGVDYQRLVTYIFFPQSCGTGKSSMGHIEKGNWEVHRSF